MKELKKYLLTKLHLAWCPIDFRVKVCYLFLNIYSFLYSKSLIFMFFMFVLIIDYTGLMLCLFGLVFYLTQELFASVHCKLLGLSAD